MHTDSAGRILLGETIVTQILALSLTIAHAYMISFHNNVRIIIALI
jgi:hypothetical protein